MGLFRAKIYAKFRLRNFKVVECSVLNTPEPVQRRMEQNPNSLIIVSDFLGSVPYAFGRGPGIDSGLQRLDFG